MNVVARKAPHPRLHGFANRGRRIDVQRAEALPLDPCGACNSVVSHIIIASGEVVDVWATQAVREGRDA